VNEKAYAMLLISYSEEITGYLIKLGANNQDAQDLIQDVFVKFIEAEVEIPPSKLRAWLYKVAINKYYNLYNRKQRYSEIIERHFTHQDLSVTEDERNEELYEALGSLTYEVANVLIMYYEQEFSIKEIAVVVRKSESNVKQILSRARKQLKETLERRNK
jgi:RNA polymerase sigma-70 factor, ECF subfamily